MQFENIMLRYSFKLDLICSAQLCWACSITNKAILIESFSAGLPTLEEGLQCDQEYFAWYLRMCRPYGWVCEKFAPMLGAFCGIPAPIMGTFFKILPLLGVKNGYFPLK